MMRDIVLFLAVFAQAAPSLSSAVNCLTDVSSKVDCGFLGITQSQCETKGCCWSPDYSNSSAPWCFNSAVNCPTEASSKVDCGYTGITQTECETKGCCWSPDNSNSNVPWCFNSGSSSYYTLTSIKNTPSGITGILELQGAGTSTYGPDVKTLKLDVFLGDEYHVRVKITDNEVKRWEVPQSIVDRSSSMDAESKSTVSTHYSFSYTSSPFTFTVKRLSDGAVIFSSLEDLVFKDQFIQFGSVISPSSSTFGIGESTRLEHALIPGSTYTLWAADIAAATFYSNLYGSFPFYLQMLNGQAHGALFMNSNGMDVMLSSSNDQIVFKTIGGIIDLYVFSGPKPSDVVNQYLSIVGKPAMMPYWSLGFHNCKYGYTSLQQVEDVVTNYSAAGIPLETQWVDIDYMNKYMDFTTDPNAFPSSEMKSFVDYLHSKNQQMVPIIDPGILVKSGYDAYESGLDADVFIKDIKGGNYLGQVWPGPTLFPDFFHPNSQGYWTTQLKAFHDMVPVDGLWIDMNEASNFCNVDGKGQVCENTAPGGCPTAQQTTCCLVCSTVDSTNSLDFPPYSIHNRYGLLSTKTLAMSAMHYGSVSEYNVHNLYGISEQIATASALKDIRGRRPFLLTRSSFPGTGVHSAKWTGDNAATWDDLKSSVVSILDFNMFGVPMVGADICGFLGNTNEELCARWAETGAFYPFVRNHNALGSPPQEFYLWPSVTEASKKALAMRYRLLPYIYTLFYRAHTSGGVVASPVFFTFPNDVLAIGINEQFMLGKSILISPVLHQGSTSVNAYFPQQLWYNFKDFSLAVDASLGGKHVSISTPLTEVNVHIKGGSILPLQESAMTTTEARKTPFTLVVALCPDGEADGELYWDDGEQIDLTNFVTAEYTAEVAANRGEISAMTAVSNDKARADFEPLRFESFIVLGRFLQMPSSIVLSSGGRQIPIQTFTFESNKITFSGIDLSITEPFTLTWSY